MAQTLRQSAVLRIESSGGAAGTVCATITVIACAPAVSYLLAFGTRRVAKLSSKWATVAGRAQRLCSEPGSGTQEHHES